MADAPITPRSSLEKITRPVLRYHGGKWRLAPWVIEHFPPHRIYVEPFGGGASVLMRKRRSYAEIYNDLDSEIVNTFRVLRDPVQSATLRAALYLTPFARAEYDATFDGGVIDEVEAARRTIVRSLMGFASASVTSVYKSGFRNNATRSGTVPAVDWARYPFHIEAFVERLRGVVIENRDALEIIRQFDTPSTLHYLDPPYPMTTRWKSRPAQWNKSSYRHELTDEQHAEIAEAAHQVNGLVLISTYPSDMYDELYKGWHRVSRRVQIEGGKKTGAGGRYATEVLYVSPRARAAGQQRSFLDT